MSTTLTLELTPEELTVLRALHGTLNNGEVVDRIREFADCSEMEAAIDFLRQDGDLTYNLFCRMAGLLRDRVVIDQKAYVARIRGRGSR